MICTASKLCVVRSLCRWPLVAAQGEDHEPASGLSNSSDEVLPRGYAGEADLAAHMVAGRIPGSKTDCGAVVAGVERVHGGLASVLPMLRNTMGTNHNGYLNGGGLAHWLK